MGYLLEYDETNPISIETYGKRLIGKILILHIVMKLMENYQKKKDRLGNI